ncbi:MAG: ankyrin repeat domain-containing protein [Pedobacter sp.]|nr:MAG: ankyrin repeat domain-containing protein [Pedobacter sp.]
MSLFFILVFILQSCEYKAKKNAQALNKTVEKQEINQIQNVPDTIKIPIPTDEIVDEFYQAIFDIDNKKVREMLETKFPANYQPKNKIAPLQAVIWTSDNLYITRLLVEGGAKINDKEKPLTVVAAEYGRLGILEYLIEKGGDIKNNEAFNKAGFHQFYDCAKLLLLNGANQVRGDLRGKFWVYEQAVNKADYEALNKLALTDEELNHNNCNGETALIIAVKQNNLEMVEYLLKRKVDKNKKETFDCGDKIHYGKTPVHIARENDFQKITALLE